MRRGGTEVTAERLQNTTGLRCEGTMPAPAPARGEKPAREGVGESLPDSLPPRQDLAFCGRSVLCLTGTVTRFLLTGRG